MATQEPPKTKVGHILGFTVPASVERFVRTLGNIALGTMVAAIPDVQAAVSAVIPPQYLVAVGAITSLVFKQLRLQFPDSAILKAAPI